MRHRGRYVGLVVCLTVCATVGMGAVGWACVPVATIQATPAEVQAGQQVTVNGIRFLGFGPVDIRLGTLDGPILATEVISQSSNTIFRTTVTIPPGTPPGPAVLIATQNPAEGGPIPFGVPARTVVNVVGPDGQAPAPEPPEVLSRPSGLSRASVSPVAFLLVAFGVATVALLAAGVLALAAGRRGPADTAPAPEAGR